MSDATLTARCLWCNASSHGRQISPFQKGTSRKRRFLRNLAEQVSQLAELPKPLIVDLCPKGSILGSHAEDDSPTDLLRRLGRQHRRQREHEGRALAVDLVEEQPAHRAATFPAEQIHWGRADETGDKEIRGPLIKFEGAGDLHHLPILHHTDEPPTEVCAGERVPIYQEALRLGYYNRMSPFAGLVLGLAFYASQIALSNGWLRRFRFGPVEWLWRCITYWKLQPFRAK